MCCIYMYFICICCAHMCCACMCCIYACCTQHRVCKSDSKHKQHLNASNGQKASRSEVSTVDKCKSQTQSAQQHPPGTLSCQRTAQSCDLVQLQMEQKGLYGTAPCLAPHSQSDPPRSASEGLPMEWLISLHTILLFDSIQDCLKYAKNMPDKYVIQYLHFPAGTAS